MASAGLIRRIIVAPILICMGVASAIADDGSLWNFEVGGYGFIPISVEGTSTVDGGAVNLDLGPDEIFDIFEFAISGRFEGWRDNPGHDGSAFGFVLDGQYVDLGIDATGLGPAGGATLDVDIRQGIVDLMGGYRLPRVELDGRSGQALIFDVLAGARYNFLRQKIKVTPGLPGPFSKDLGEDKHWIEPVIGARARWVLNERWNFNLRGDLAGFGVEGDDLTWSLTGTAAWRAWEKTTIRFGYRVYDIRYSEGSGADEFALDVREHGPIVGVTYRF